MNKPLSVDATLISKLNYILPKKYRIAYLVYVFSLILGLFLQLIGISSLAPLFTSYFGENINPSYYSYFSSFINNDNINLFSFMLIFGTYASIAIFGLL